MAAEGAILNEMLEIVAKRAALRPSDAGMAGDGAAGDGLDSDVSSYPFSSWAFVFTQIAISFACILWYANTRSD